MTTNQAPRGIAGLLGPGRWAAVVLVGLAGGRGAPARAGTFHISPAGDDQRDGRSPAAAWRTVARVNAAAFAPGDEVRFERGGEWRERLVPSSSGAAGRPILFAAYGVGPKPRFWGSDPVDPARFEPTAGGGFRVAMADPVHAVLLDHAFLRSARLVTQVRRPGGQPRPRRGAPRHLVRRRGRPPAQHRLASPRGGAPSSSATTSSPRTGAITWSSATWSSTSRPGSTPGTAFRIMGSADVRARRVRGLPGGQAPLRRDQLDRLRRGRTSIAAVALPDQGAGGASAYVTYSDRTRRGDTSAYHHCHAERLDDPGSGGHYPAFVTHGEGVGVDLARRLQFEGRRGRPGQRRLGRLDPAPRRAARRRHPPGRRPGDRRRRLDDRRAGRRGDARRRGERPAEPARSPGANPGFARLPGGDHRRGPGQRDPRSARWSWPRRPPTSTPP